MYKNKIIESIKESEIRNISLAASTKKNVINLSIGEPEPDIPKSVKEVMKEAIDKDLGYTPAGGIRQLRELYANLYNKQFGANYTADNCLVNIGATEAYASFFETIIEPNDEVIVISPAYPGYVPVLKIQKAKIVVLDTSLEGYEIKASSIEKLITDKTKLIVVTTPNNPTGKTIDKKEMDKIADLLIKYNIYLLSDEIYASLTFNKFESFAQYTHLQDRIVIVSGLSKSHSMTGYRIGFSLSSKENISQMLKVSQYRTTASCTISQIGAIEAIKNHSCRKEITRKYQNKLEYLYKELKDMGFDCIKPDGGFYLYAGYKKLFSKKSFDLVMDILNKVSVAVVPASCFDDEYAIRICANKDMKTLEEFVKRLKQYINTCEIYLAGGCFWGVQKYFKLIDGVISTSVGYANGKTENTNYKILKETDHVETCHVIYDKSKVSLEELLEKLYKVIDPTSINKQGEDEGRQYRTGIYYTNELDKNIINESLNKLQSKLDKKVTVELMPLKHYILAEEYHQDYLDKNPNGYCHIKF